MCALSKCNEDCYIDIYEQDIESKYPGILRILLRDRTTNKNIIWACDSYKKYGESYTAKNEITIRQITGKHTKIIRPRIAKNREEQQNRTRKSAEVFTPSWICNEMNNYCDAEWFRRLDVFNLATNKLWRATTDKIAFPENKNWQKYVDLRCLEITCGEGPYLTSRYDTTTGDYIPVEQRIGIIDRKLRIINENTDNMSDWLKWATRAFESTYGYEYQGDNLLLTRENMIWTFIDNYKCQFNAEPDLKTLKQIAKIISWNIWQMNGLTDCIPCFGETDCGLQLSLFGGVIPNEGQPQLCQIKNWRNKKNTQFQELKGATAMKFDYCVGNPPYQGDNHQQIYPYFYLQGREIANHVELIFPTGWQAPKNANNLRLLNNAGIKEDEQIVFIDNKQNVFQGVAGAEWTNIVFWKRGHNNGLNGLQNILTNRQNSEQRHLNYDNSQIEKPYEIRKLFNLVREHGNFVSIDTITSSRKPYGLSTDIAVNATKYGLPELSNIKQDDTDIKVYCKSETIKYVPRSYPLPKTTSSFEHYKVFVPYAWGNMAEKTGLGGAFSNIVIASPNEICTESYLESGCFIDLETAKRHAKYLMTKFVRALLYVNKFSQHSTTSWGAIPVQDYSEPWWTGTISEIDNALMDKYSIPENIRRFVFSNIQTKKESNIINYNED